MHKAVLHRLHVVAIVWYMATPGYKLAANPVVFPSDVRGQFLPSDPRFCYFWRPATVYVCLDWNYDTADVGYTLNVQATSGSNAAQGNGRIINN